MAAGTWIAGKRPTNVPQGCHCTTYIYLPKRQTLRTAEHYIPRAKVLSQPNYSVVEWRNLTISIIYTHAYILRQHLIWVGGTWQDRRGSHQVELLVVSFKWTAGGNFSQRCTRKWWTKEVFLNVINQFRKFISPRTVNVRPLLIIKVKADVFIVILWTCVYRSHYRGDLFVISVGVFNEPTKFSMAFML